MYLKSQFSLQLQKVLLKIQNFLDLASQILDFFSHHLYSNSFPGEQMDSVLKYKDYYLWNIKSYVMSNYQC